MFTRALCQLRFVLIFQELRRIKLEKYWDFFNQNLSTLLERWYMYYLSILNKFWLYINFVRQVFAKLN